MHNLSFSIFQLPIKFGDLLEYEWVHGNRYGTLIAPLENAIDNGKVILLDIDVKGSCTLMEEFEGEVISIFIEPPGEDINEQIESVQERLKDRGQDSETLIKQRTKRLQLEIEYKDRGRFTNYYLKNGVGLDGTCFVGWEQITNDILNVGLDRNSVANDYMLYNIGGGWVNSQFPGAWMIRPVLRGTPIISSSNNQLKQDDIQIFPNPFSDFTTILIDNSAKNLILLFDISGRLISKFRVNKKSFQLSKNNLKSGVYILQVQNKKEVFRKKLVIQ